MIELFASLVIITIIKMGSCELNTTLSGYVENTEGGDIPVADIIEPGWGQDPRQSPNRFLNRPVKHRIIGGSKADIELYPYVASIRLNGGHICGSSYIHVGWILTAVHCIRRGELFEMVQVKDLLVKMGSADLFAEDAQSRKVQKAIAHEKYDTKYNFNDIALLKLSEPFDLGPKTKTVALQTVDRNLKNVMCSVAGWGFISHKDSKGHREVSSSLMKLEVAITDERECMKIYAIPGTIKEDRIICAGVPNKRGTCQGDSGGPLVCDGKQVGIVSAGRGCANEIPTVYARVSNYMGWIKTHIKSFPIDKHPVKQSGNISFKYSVYIIILGEFIFQNILLYY